MATNSKEFLTCAKGQNPITDGSKLERARDLQNAQDLDQIQCMWSTACVLGGVCFGFFFYLEREFGWRARSNGTERTPEVYGGGQRTWSQQDRSLDTDAHSILVKTRRGDRQRKAKGRQR